MKPSSLSRCYPRARPCVTSARVDREFHAVERDLGLHAALWGTQTRAWSPGGLDPHGFIAVTSLHLVFCPLYPRSAAWHGPDKLAEAKTIGKIQTGAAQSSACRAIGFTSVERASFSAADRIRLGHPGWVVRLGQDRCSQRRTGADQRPSLGTLPSRLDTYQGRL